jgi:phosphoribosylformylglycinamidine cyclo-ligase
LPEGLGARIDLDAWPLLPVFQWLAAQGGLDQAEMLKTFNCGIGMVAIVSPDMVGVAQAAFAQAGHEVFEIGAVGDEDGVHYTGALL